jgi:hypothetical protein
MRFFGVVLCTLILISSSCSNSSKSGRIPESTIIKILADIHIADAISFSTKYRNMYRNNDSVTYYDHLFAKYNVTRVQFDSTISWYSGNPDKYDQLYDKVLDRLNRMSAGLNDKLRADSLKTMSGNLWNKKRDWILPDDGATENISFAIKIQRKGRYQLTAKIKITPNDQSVRPYMTAFTTRAKIMNPNFSDSTTRVALDKSGILRQYSLSVSLDKDTVTFLKGYILGSEPRPGSWTKHAEVRDIRLIYISSEKSAPIE